MNSLASTMLWLSFFAVALIEVNGYTTSCEINTCIWGYSCFLETADNSPVAVCYKTGGVECDDLTEHDWDKRQTSSDCQTHADCMDSSSGETLTMRKASCCRIIPRSWNSPKKCIVSPSYYP